MFVGRAAELRAITAELDVAADGGTGALHLVGAAGIGKTTLARRAAAQSRDRGFTVAWAHAWSRTAAPPYWLWSQVLAALDTPLRLPSRGDAAARETVLRAFLATMRTTAAGGPLLVVLDDLHEADPASLHLTAALLGNPPDRPLLVLSTQRPGFARLAEVNRRGRAVAVPALDRTDVEALIAARPPAGPIDADAVLRLTGGNPFFVTEALRTDPATASRQRTGALLAAVCDDTRRLVAAAAVIGARPEPGVLAATAGLDPDRFAAASAHAVTADLLVAGHAFRHAIVQEYCYDAIPVTERAALHTAAADALDGVRPGGTQAAHHRRTALPYGDPGAAVAATCAAARAAVRVAAVEDAIAQCTAGLDAVAPYGDEAAAWRAELLMLRGEAEAMGGDPHAGRRSIERAIGFATAAGAPVLVAEAALRLPRIERFMVADHDLERQLQAALDKLGDRDPALRIRLLARIAYDAAIGDQDIDAPRTTQRRATAERVVSEARAYGDPGLLAETLSTGLFVSWAPETLDERLTTGAEIVRLGRRTGDLSRELDGLLWTFVARLESGRVDEAAAALTEYTYHAERGRRPEHLLYARSRAATLHALQGRFADAERLIPETREHAVAAGSPDVEPVHISQLGLLAWSRGGADAHRLTAACQRVGAIAHPLMAVIAPLFEGRAEEARAPLRAVAAMFDRVPGPSRLFAYLLFAEAAHVLGEREVAADLYPRLLPFPGRCAVSAGGTAAMGATTRGLGLCALTVGDLDTAVSWLRAAVDDNRAMGARPHVAVSQCDLAEALLRRGDRADDLLAEAATTAATLGMDRLGARIAELRAQAPEAQPERDGRTVSLVAAVLGPDADRQLLAAASGLPPDRFLAALGGLTPVPESSLTPDERCRLNLRAAEAIERLGLHRRHRDRLAAHRRAALPLGDPQAAVATSLDAARVAMGEFRPADAIAHCTAALDAIAAYGETAGRWRAELLVALGTAQGDAGDLPAARRSLTDAIDLAHIVDATELAVEATLGMPLPERYLSGDRSVELALRGCLGDATPTQRIRLQARLAADALADRTATDPERDALITDAVEAARTLGDGPLLVETLTARLRVILGPDSLHERQALATEVIELSQHHVLPAAEIEGRLHRFTALLETGRVQPAAVEADRIEALATAIRHPRWLMYARSRAGTLAALRGEFDDADRLAHEAADVGRAHTPDAPLLLHAQLFGVSWTRKRFADGTLAAMVRRTGTRYPALLAVELMMRGDVEPARQQLRGSLCDLDEVQPVAFLEYFSVTGELAYLLDEPDVAADVYRRLLPYADRFVVHALGSVCMGSVLRPLGLCAVVTGDLDTAVTHLREAVARNRLAGARPFVAAAQLELADALRRRGDRAEAACLVSEAEPVVRSLGMTWIPPFSAVPPTPTPGSAEISLARQGKTWRLDYRHRTVHLPHSKGLTQLATLLANPGREISAVELAGGVDTTVRTPMIDAEARLAYQRRLSEVDTMLEQADRHGDRAAGERAANERAALLRELNSVTGRNGRVRAFSDDTERARVNVTRTLRQAIDQIEAAHPEAGVHLRAGVRTGTRCSYRP